MHTKEIKHFSGEPFASKKVYYSGSIHGVINHEPDFAWQLVQFMKLGGADVLSDLSLVHQTKVDKLSWMIRGVQHQHFYFRTYISLEDAKQLIHNFLIDKLSI